MLLLSKSTVATRRAPPRKTKVSFLMPFLKRPTFSPFEDFFFHPPKNHFNNKTKKRICTTREKKRKEKKRRPNEKKKKKKKKKKKTIYYDNDTARGIILGMFEKMMEIKRSRFFLVLGV